MFENDMPMSPFDDNDAYMLHKVCRTLRSRSCGPSEATEVERMAMCTLDRASLDGNVFGFSMTEFMEPGCDSLVPYYADLVGTEPVHLAAVSEQVHLYGRGELFDPDDELLATVGNHVVWARPFTGWAVHAVVEGPIDRLVAASLGGGHREAADFVLSLGAAYVLVSPSTGESLWRMEEVGWARHERLYAW